MSSRIKSTFGKRSYLSQSQSAYKRYIIAVEGDKTEIDYFKGFNKFRKELGIRDGVNVLPLERNDTKSAPKHVFDLLNEFAQKNYELDQSGQSLIDEDDELWMVIDRDRRNNSVEQLKAVLADCNKANFNLAITNPAFELWLILHFIKFDGLKQNEIRSLYENSKRKDDGTYSKSTFSKAMMKKLESAERSKFDKGIDSFMLYKDKIRQAISEAELLENNVDILIADNGVSSLGTNIHALIEKFFKS